jgi:hypothetical protein
MMAPRSFGRFAATLFSAGLVASCVAPVPDPLTEVCPEEKQYFEQAVWRPILSVRCIGCHNASGPAQASRMVLAPDTEPGYLENNLRQVLAVAKLKAGDRSLLVAMPTNTNPDREHPGGRLVELGGRDYQNLQGLAERLSTAGCSSDKPVTTCSDEPVLPRRLWRLTPSQYDNTVETLVGLSGEWGKSFPTDTVVNGFDNPSEELLITPLFADKLQAAAEDIAERADLSRILPCAPATGNAACAEDFIAQFGERAFRRQLTAADKTRYQGLFATAPDFTSGVRLVLTAMLQSPHLIYRRELGLATATNSYTLSDYEIASELSYLIWDDMPDESLFAKARAGALHTPEQVLAEAERLLASPRARPVLQRFLFQWLGIDSLMTVPKDAQTFPELDTAARTSLIGEAERVISQVVFDGSGLLADLITTPNTFLDPKLAAFYGVELPQGAADSSGFRAVQLPRARRQGVLTLGGVMLAHGRSNDSSPVHRGRLVRERFLCQPPPEPPPGINAEPPPLDPSLTARQRYAAHAQNEPCASCHRLMDPIGFAFEHFDGIGRYRESDNGNPIDVTGEIVSSPSSDAEFEGTEELAAILAGSTDVANCFALQWFRYGGGFSDSQGSECAAQKLRQQLGTEDLSVRSLVLGLVRMRFFTARGTVPDAPASVIDAGAARDAAPPRTDAAVDAGSPQPGDAGKADATPPANGYTLERVIDNDWGGGYCHTYKVTSTSPAPLTWSVTLPIDGTLNQNWESQVSTAGGNATFTGAPHNATIQPGNFAQFGFCVTR